VCCTSAEKCLIKEQTASVINQPPSLEIPCHLLEKVAFCHQAVSIWKRQAECLPEYR